MFGIGNKRKEERTYEDDYAYDTYAYDEYDEYEPYNEYSSYEEERPRQAGARRPARAADVGGTRENGIPRGEEDAYASSAVSEETTELRHELLRLEEITQRLTAQLEVKQGEVSRVTALLTEKETQASTALASAQQESYSLKEALGTAERELLEANQLAESQKTDYESKLMAATERIQELETQSRQQESMKNDLANIIIETKEQGRDIVERAQWEANRIRERAEIDARKLVADASVELRVVKQEAAQYHDRLVVMKDEAAQLFDKLLNSSEQLSKIESQGA